MILSQLRGWFCRMSPSICAIYPASDSLHIGTSFWVEWTSSTRFFEEFSIYNIKFSCSGSCYKVSYSIGRTQYFIGSKCTSILAVVIILDPLEWRYSGCSQHVLSLVFRPALLVSPYYLIRCSEAFSPLSLGVVEAIRRFRPRSGWHPSWHCRHLAL